MKLSAIDNLARRLSEKVPPGLKHTREELQASFRGVLHAGLHKMDVVTHEEFEVQRAVLERTREKLEALEKIVAAMENPAAVETETKAEAEAAATAETEAAPVTAEETARPAPEAA